MNKKLSTPAASVAAGKVLAPIKVRLKRVNCDRAIRGGTMLRAYATQVEALRRLRNGAQIVRVEHVQPGAVWKGSNIFRETLLQHFAGAERRVADHSSGLRHRPI